ncbi:MAG: hypothetical protein KC410_14560 [Anaerolineales bacterium]|nr:hypothetical protein [Anaerolineales bacterium]
MVHLEGLWYVSRGDGGQFDIDPLVHSVAFHVLVCLFLSRAYSRRYGDHMDSDPSPAPQTYYVERNLRIDEFARWAKGGRGGEGDPPGGNPNGASMRLRSVIGPPGGGKSMFLRQLHATLEIHSSPLFVFPVLSLKEVNDSELLWRWLEKATEEAKEHRLYGPLQPHDHTAYEIGIATVTLCHTWGANFQLLLVDAYEDALPSWKQEIEQFLAEVLNAPHARIVLTRRDEYALEEARLRWEEEVLRLEPLSSPAEQIRRRLEMVSAPAWPREDMEGELDQLIKDANLTINAREGIVRDLMNILTPNPYINLLLLRHKLQNPLPVKAHKAYKDACLTEYLARVKLEAKVYLPLLQRITAINNLGEFKGSDYGGHGIEASRLEQLMAAGIVNPVPGTQRYQLEPAIVSLIN